MVLFLNLQFVDGWELNGSYFPNEEDYNKPEKDRFREYCGKRRVKEVLESSQNAALVRYQVPEGGKGFSFYFTTRKNPTRKFARRLWCNNYIKFLYTLNRLSDRSSPKATFRFAPLNRITYGIAGDDIFRDELP